MKSIKVRDIAAELSPREFCRAWYELDQYSREEILEAETEPYHRKRCIKLLVETTGIAERTVRAWGNGLNFEKMPPCYRKTLGYAIKAKKLTLMEIRSAA